MVATSINEQLNTSFSRIFDIETIKYKAEEKGHKKWKEEAEAAGFTAGFPDRERKMRTGLIPYPLIKAIQFQYERANGEIKDLLLSNVIRMILKFTQNSSNSSDKLILDPEIEKLLRRADKNLLEIDSDEKEGLKKWIEDIATDWAFRNEKWGEDAEFIIKHLDQEKDSLEELNQMLLDIESIKEASTAADLISIFRRDNKVFLYLSEVHGNWRETVIKNINHNSSEIKITREDSKENIIDIIENNQAIKDLIVPFTVGLSEHVKMYSTINNEVIFKQRLLEIIEAYRSIYNKKEEISQEATFFLMLKLASIIENQITEDTTHPSVKVLQNLRDYLLDEIKKDTNTGPLETIIDYLNNHDN